MKIFQAVILVAGGGISSSCIGCRRRNIKLLYWQQEEEYQVVILVAGGGISSSCIGCRSRNIKLLYQLQEEEYQVVILVAGGGISSCYIGCRRRNLKLLYWLQEEEYQVVILVAGGGIPSSCIGCRRNKTTSYLCMSFQIYKIYRGDQSDGFPLPHIQVFNISHTVEHFVSDNLGSYRYCLPPNLIMQILKT